MKNNWFDICAWSIITVACIYSTIYGTYRIIETLIK